MDPFKEFQTLSELRAIDRFIDNDIDYQRFERNEQPDQMDFDDQD